MGKNKLKRFAENSTFAHLLQPSFEEISAAGFPLKGNWNRNFFPIPQPVTLELGCGKGEYTVGLGKMYPERNFIGVDVKGARLWRGARTVEEDGMKNVAFIRARIDQIASYFDVADQVENIWITFPDPQPRESKEKKRLTSAPFLQRYRKFSLPHTRVHLKTDSDALMAFTLQVIEAEKLRVHTVSRNMDADFPHHPELSILTYYESRWREMGIPVQYICFDLFAT